MILVSNLIKNIEAVIIDFLINICKKHNYVGVLLRSYHVVYGLNTMVYVLYLVFSVMLHPICLLPQLGSRMYEFIILNFFAVFFFFFVFEGCTMYKFEKAYFNDNINLLDPLICFLGEEANDVNRLSCNCDVYMFSAWIFLAVYLLKY